LNVPVQNRGGFVDVRGVEADVTELRDAGRAVEGHRRRQGDLADDQISPVAERVVEGQVVVHVAGAGAFLGTAPHRQAGVLEFGLRRGEGVDVRQREPGADHTGRALDEGEAVVAPSAPQVGDAVLLLHQFEADDVVAKSTAARRSATPERT
jgi:hypothetical protein